VYRSDDPWSQTGNYNTPFDQAFYLVLNVAVGGTGGYFPYASFISCLAPSCFLVTLGFSFLHTP
jgi:hypothetical protein